MADESAGDIAVLYVGDEPPVADQLEREDERLSFETASNASEGLEHIAESHVDCVLSDYDISGGTGIDFLASVRDDWPDLPFLLLTDHHSETVASDAVSAGVTDCFRRDTGQYSLLATRVVNAVESRRTSDRVEGRDLSQSGVAQELTRLTVDLLQTERASVDDLIGEALETIGAFADADRSYVFQFDDGGDTLSNTHEWSREGVEPQKGTLQNLSRESFPWWMEQLESFENITIPDVRDLPPAAETEQEILQEQNIRSLAAVPMIFEGELVGFIGFDWVRDREELSAGLVDVLRVAGQLITVVLRRETRRRELERREAYLEQSSDIISVMDSDGQIKYQSKSTEDVTGFSPEEVLGDSGLEHVHPDDRADIADRFSSFVREPDAEITDELRVQTADGSWRWIEVRGVNKLEDPVIEGLVFSSRDVTSRKEREREIQRLNERLELAVEGAELGVWDWDMTTDEVEFNEQWAEMLCHSVDEIEPHLDAWENRVHPDDLDDVETALDAHIAGETEYYDTEHRMQTASGDWKWIRDVGKVVERDDTGDPVRAVGIHLDIDDRKRREQKLQQFRDAVERTAHAVYITDTDGTIEYVNSAFETMTGYSEEEALGQTPRILQSGEYDDEYYEEFWETITSGKRWEREMIDEQADGDRVVFDQSIAPLLDEDGEPRKFVAVAQNITERKEYQQQLEQTREDLRQIIDLVPDLIFAKDREGKYLLANERTAEVYGLSPEDVEGNREVDIIPDVDDSEQFREDDLAVIESGEPKYIPEEELTTADGETRILETTKIPYKILRSGDDAVLGYARDVTELKRYEQELETQRDNLEVLNQIVRHDIRNNLQIVSAYAETLERHVDDTGDEYVDNILDASHSAIELTETARDVTQVMLQSETELSAVNLHRVLEGEVDDVRSNYESALVTIEGSVPTVTVAADAMLESVFRNLLSNAIQHNDKEIPEVTVSAAVEDGMARVEIADNGPGIPDDRKPEIFDEGVQGLDSTGTGLGLYLVETLAERYGGDVWVEDNEPEGSVFVVTLPVASATTIPRGQQ